MNRSVKVNRARSSERVLTPLHLGHALGGKAGNEAVAQVAHAADVDVAHRVVVGASEAPFIGLCGYCRLPSCICDSRRLSSCLAAPMGPRPAPGWPASGSWSRVVVPKGHKRAHEFREGARHGDVVLREPFGTLDCCVCTVG